MKKNYFTQLQMQIRQTSEIDVVVENLTQCDTTKGTPTAKAIVMGLLHAVASFFNSRQMALVTAVRLAETPAAPPEVPLKYTGHYSSPPPQNQPAGPPAAGVSVSETPQARQSAPNHLLKTKKPNTMKNLYLTQTAQLLTGRTNETTRGTAQTGAGDPPKNSLRLNAARILVSLILLLVMQGMAWGQTAGPSNSTSNSQTSPGTS